MVEYYGGGIPFSAMLKGSKTTKRKKQRTKKRKSRNTKKKKSNSIKDNLCKCKINKKSNTPDGLGFCAQCSPLNIMMRGKDKKLYEIKENKEIGKFWKLVN